jgi:MOSC domain-containing protein YiiM
MSIRLIEGQGVDGDAHRGIRVQHRSRKRHDPELPNLRQVHLIHSELLTELGRRGFALSPGELGENILTEGLDLLGLGCGTVLVFEGGGRVQLTGLRNPCVQLERHRSGLMEAVLERRSDGGLIRKCGVMAIVVESGDVSIGDDVMVIAPDGPVVPLLPV